MKAAVCPFCDVVSGLPHHSQQACIDALHKEIARTREVLERRTDALITGTARTRLQKSRVPALPDSHVRSAPRLYLRCAIET
jgi:hypothetical protein